MSERKLFLGLLLVCCVSCSEAERSGDPKAESLPDDYFEQVHRQAWELERANLEAEE